MYLFSISGLEGCKRKGQYRITKEKFVLVGIIQEGSLSIQ